MIKKNKWKLLISSIVILLPMVSGLIVWNKLPEKMATHWGTDGNANGWSNRSVAVLAIPLFLLLTHWLCIFCTSKDSKNKNQSKKVFGMLLWICPIISLVVNGTIYATAFEKAIDINLIIYLLVGILFIIIGNYLPKCKQNYTIGIRVRWALDNEENWNATHRFAGKVWTIGGVLIMVCSFLPEAISIYVFMALVIILTIMSLGYSYYYFKVKQGGK